MRAGRWDVQRGRVASIPGPMRRMILVLVLLAAACSSGGTEGSSTSAAPSTTVPPAATSAAADGGLGYRWQVGDCVVIDDPEDLPYEPYGPVVDCSRPHVYEVYFIGTFLEGEDEEFPDDLDDRIREACAAGFVEYVGVHMSQSVLDVIFYLPDGDEWSRGLRYQACVLFDPGAGGELPLVEGSRQGSATLLERGAGECLEDHSLRSPVVACNTVHRAEVIGSFTHPAQPGDPYPGIEEYRSASDDACMDLLRSYATEGESGAPVLPVALGGALTAVEWGDGLRTVPCVAVVLDAARIPLPVVGSLAEPGWRVLQGGTAA